jgi:hypothetical protein
MPGTSRCRPGGDVLAPVVDGPGASADDRLVAAGPGPDEPVVLPGPRLAAVGSQVSGDERQAGDVGQAELVACRQWVPGRQHEDAWLRPHRHQLDPGRRDRRAQQGDVAAVVKQAGRRLSHVEDLQVHLDVRVRALEGGEQPGPGLVLGARADPD